MPKNTENFSYQEYITEVIEAVTREFKYPRKKEYSIAVAKLKTKRECKNGGRYTADQVRPSVSKAIDKMVADPKGNLICYQNKYYLPKTEKYLYEKLSEEYLNYLRDKIKVIQKDVCLISYNMCAVWAESLENSDTDSDVYHCLSECLGEYCYAISGEEDFSYVIVKCSDNISVVPDQQSKEFAVIRALATAISNLYSEQHITLQKTKKEGT